jgi:hypothetical protein
MINFIIENQSLIKSYITDIETRKKKIKKLYVIQNDMRKILCLPNEAENQLRKYYKKELNENELHLAIREDFVHYTLEEFDFDKNILNRLNSYIDAILRKGESIDTTKSYWSIWLSDSFYDYQSVTIFFSTINDRKGWFYETLELVFLFDKKNKIKNVNICLLHGL